MATKTVKIKSNNTIKTSKPNYNEKGYKTVKVQNNIIKVFKK